MKRGPKPKPNAIKRLHGNTGHRGESDFPPIEETDGPEITSIDAPSYLGSAGRQEWERIVPILCKMRIVRELDTALLSGYCAQFETFYRTQSALERMADKGGDTAAILTKTTNGNVIQNPLLGIRNSAIKEMTRMASELGLTPSSRSRLYSEGKGAAANPFDAF